MNSTPQTPDKSKKVISLDAKREARMIPEEHQGTSMDDGTLFDPLTRCASLLAEVGELLSRASGRD